ncbi:MAG: hypothetical protein GY820_20610 [Gammaproteobacteria bacterium]|nr:hypothetical protein [Gammaproteobacteria bacterium]
MSTKEGLTQHWSLNNKQDKQQLRLHSWVGLKEHASCEGKSLLTIDDGTGPSSARGTNIASRQR